MMQRLYTARKTHKCYGGCGKDIEPGEKYLQEICPPWEDAEGDEVDGRTVYILLPEEDRRWHMINYHYPDCYYLDKW